MKQILGKWLTACLALGIGVHFCTMPLYARDILYAGKRDEKRIAITFDDGPHPGQTGRILKVLEEYGIQATFFVIGQNVRNYPQVLSQVAAAGHEIGNHTYHHLDVSKLDSDSLRRELQLTAAAVRSLTGAECRLFRPPTGAIRPDQEEQVRSMGYRTVCWSIDTEDWRGMSADTIASTVLGRVRGGDIILFHDYISPRSHTPEALRQIIPILLQRGYSFVTVSELMNAGE